MKQRMRIRIGVHGSGKGLKNQRVVIPVSDHIGNNATVIKVEDRAEVNLVYLNALIPFELSNICEPFLVRPVRMKITGKKILSYVLRII